MRVLLTNDDGIEAEGLQAMRRALLAIGDVELAVIAPDGNRSAFARMITTRRPLWVQEVPFDDGTVGYATDGTPVDCVRLAKLGLIEGFEAEIVIAGINHGSNLGDDITYSGTVAAALEGIVLGIPALALSQQSSGGGMGYVSGRFNFAFAGPFTARLVERLVGETMPPETLVNVNLPSCEPTGIEVTRLGKRLYDDELKLVDEDPETGKLRYEIYGFEPSFKDEAGTDLSAIAQGRISVTPIHFDLTDRGGLDRLRAIDFEAMLASAV